jgi:hypothetical protein
MGAVPTVAKSSRPGRAINAVVALGIVGAASDMQLSAMASGKPVRL